MLSSHQAGCFFKLQKDVRGLYGGEKYAMKATSAELRNIKVSDDSITMSVLKVTRREITNGPCRTGYL